MNRHVNAVAGRLSLRPPQRHSLEILDRITEIAPPQKNPDVQAALAAIRSEFPTVTDFERDFPSLCFALATGVGKTRLMGAFISYLHLAHGVKNFFVLAPNLTIYNKLIADFTPNTPKYVFKGISEFATDAPAIITGDNYESMAGTLFDQQLRCKINIFNISKINSEVRGGKSPRVKRLSEYIGESYFSYLAALPDLVLLMDESHRYRASAGVKAINELKPVIGLELTATPIVEGPKGPIRFKNIIYDYPLSQALADGFVKEPAVVTRKDFNPAGMSTEAIEQMKLEDGIRLHERIKVEFDTYSRQTGNPVVKPFILVIARDTTHARQLLERVESDLFEGRYRGKAIQVDSSQTGADEEKMITSLLEVERSDSPTEIVIHVNMLKEGWDVTNLYTIVPLRAANARVLIEQSIGRGLRLPYGKRTGVSTVDTLNIVAHDKFQEIVDEANRSDSAIRLKSIVMDPSELAQRPRTVVSPPKLDSLLGIQPDRTTTDTFVAGAILPPAFARKDEQEIAQITRDVIRQLERRPGLVPSAAHLAKPEVQAEITKAVMARYQPVQLTLEGVVEKPDIAAVVAKTSALVERQTISIPRIVVLPTGEVKCGFHPFNLELNMNYPPVSEDLWVQHLRTGEREILRVGVGGGREHRLEDYVVSGLVDFNDISYDDHSELLYDLAGQTVRHFLGYLSEEDARRVLRCHQKEIAKAIHAQMQKHFWEEAPGYVVEVRSGFSELKSSAYTADGADPVQDFHVSPQDKSNMAKYLFGGFEHCLYSVEKFHSDTERRMAVILEREHAKWFKPVKGQFQLFYRIGADHSDYQPDFVAETQDAIYMLETKAANQMTDPDVLAKRDAAVLWCKRASDHAATYGGKHWTYVLIPHDAVTDNMSLFGLAARYRCEP